MIQKALPIHRGFFGKKWLTAMIVVQMCALLAGAHCAVAQTGKFSSEKRAKIESAISKFIANDKTPGLSVAVVENGEFVWSEGFGMADLENSVPATSQTVYRIGSISKSITATAAMQLWQSGKLDLDAPVQ